MSAIPAFPASFSQKPSFSKNNPFLSPTPPLTPPFPSNALTTPSSLGPPPKRSSYRHSPRGGTFREENTPPLHHRPHPTPSGSHAPSSGSHALESEEEGVSSRSESPRIPSLAPVTYRWSRGGNHEETSWQQLSQNVIKELMKALKEYGRTSPYFLGLLNGQLTGSVVVPHDLKHLFRCLHSKTEYQLWEATWKALLLDALPSLLETPDTAVDNEGNLITIKHLMGEGNWETPQKQAASLPREVLHMVSRIAEKAFVTMRPSGPLQSYLDVFQGTNEHYLQFVERLTAAVENQEEDEVARGRLLQSLAFKHANQVCKQAILTLPREPKPTLQDFIKVVTEVVPLMTPGHPEKRQHRQTVAAATASETQPSPMTNPVPGPRPKGPNR
ncbi:hypothetical protein HGM15179_018557 [Zosterops borbonicus]|uniref:Retroviral nucleocapsid Gag protein p24 C-terminal domain-containing protein n=1 Tax=Zosterops borbonicus TaxID=364589 RepID=A0A8K1FWK3_9PASS|nr:hypothetical protein HGM15179_018557 [Zosterops borbonicus]